MEWPEVKQHRYRVRVSADYVVEVSAKSAHDAEDAALVVVSTMIGEDPVENMHVTNVTQQPNAK